MTSERTLTCICCDKDVAGDTESACPACGFVDPLKSFFEKEYRSAAIFDKIRSRARNQLNSVAHLQCLKRQARIVQDVVEPLLSDNNAIEGVREDMRREIDTIKGENDFYRTLLVAYEQNQYTINLDSHVAETDLRVQSGAWGVIQCPKDDCVGRAFQQTGACTICNGSVCFSCFSEKHDGHACDVRKVMSVQEIVKTSIPCPMCATPITKSDGCDQMFCTRCNHSFDYKTGTGISRRNLHNPHYAEFQQQQRENGAESLSWLEQNVFIQHNTKEELLVDTLKSESSSSSDIIFESGKVTISRRDTDCYKVQLKDDNREVEASISVYTNGVFPSTWSRVKCADGEIINEFDYWMDRYRYEIREYARTVPEQVEIQDNEDVLTKIRWMESAISDDEYVRRVFRKRDDLVAKQFNWMLLKNFIQTMLNINGYTKQAMIDIVKMVSDCKSNGKQMPEDDIRSKIKGVYTIVRDIMSRYKDVLAAKTLFASMKKLLTMHGKSIKGCTECFVCCKDDQKASSLRCPWCLESSCEACMKQWWATDACKLELTMPCCKKTAWPLLFLFRASSRLHKTLKMLTNEAILARERAHQYRYVQFVENKRHADSLRVKIVKGEERIEVLRKAISTVEATAKNAIDKALRAELKQRCSREIGALHPYLGRIFSPQNLDLPKFQLLSLKALHLTTYHGIRAWDGFLRAMEPRDMQEETVILHAMLARLAKATTFGGMCARMYVFETLLAPGISDTMLQRVRAALDAIRSHKRYRELVTRESLSQEAPSPPPHKKQCIGR